MTRMLAECSEEPRVLRGLETANAETLTALAGVLKERKIKNVTFAGRGTSDHASIYGQYLFSILGGVNAGLAVPSCISLYGADIDYGGSLVIAVSQSGSAADALEVVRTAKRSGAVTLSITNRKDSALAKEAEFHLYCAAGEEVSVAATKTFTAQLGLLYLLAGYWFGKKMLPLENVADCVEELIEKASSDMEELALRYRYINDGFVLSRGISYPIALESMLKVQETCYVKLKAYSSADFYHGPLAQLTPETPVIVYAPKGASQAENLAIADKAASLGAQPLIVTDDAELAKSRALTYLVPDVCDELAAPIVLAAFAQLFAQTLCVMRGGNPDSPRNLSKVTVTK